MSVPFDEFEQKDSSDIVQVGRSVFWYEEIRETGSSCNEVNVKESVSESML